MKMKTVGDFCLALCLAVFLWPVLLLIAIIIRLDSPGPAFFVSKRVGKDGTIFSMLKFRSMIVGAENLRQPRLQVDESGDYLYKKRDDPRITKVGRFLRRSSLDELPQIFNVLIGQMSLVGPRPELVHLVSHDTNGIRTKVKPGMTGLWQIRGRRDLPLSMGLRYDLYYIENLSFLLDLYILFCTIGVVIKGKGSY